MSSWYTPVVSFLESSAKWMEKNPTAASMIGGALAGGAQYYTETKIQKDRERHDKKMYDRRKSDQLDNARASSGIDASGYGNHAKSLVGGTGLLNSAKGGVV
ncbi:hypothetical protein [Aliamphritea hakodatensis]|uniref:hypothetical protein n=1 Tax=Aliamphritea hakodatensis TaxID=2895352 RepID=UPI0022FD8831|nr:hypothetical protein [Aliamphritea hakodatensis]